MQKTTPIFNNNTSWVFAASVSAGIALLFASPTTMSAAEEFVLTKKKDCTVVQTANAVGSSTDTERLTQSIMLAKNTSLSLEEISRKPCVKSVERNHTVRTAASPNDSRFNEQWALQNTGQTVLKKQGNQGVDIGYTEVFSDVNRINTSTNVAVVDTGVNEIGELSGRVTAGVDVLQEDGNPADENGHGTAMASIIAAQTNNNAKIAGVNDAVNVMPVRVLKDNGTGKISNLIKGIDYAIKNDADVINLSLVSPYSSQVNKVIKRAYTNDVMVVGAAGNSAEKITESNKRTPISNEKNADWILGVGAHGSKGKRVSSSNYGDHVDTLAPGENILTVNHDGQLQYQTGTSIAAAITAGTLSVWDAMYGEISPNRGYELLTTYRSNNRLDLASALQSLRYPDGTLLRSPNSGVYRLENGKKRPIPHPAVFLSYDYEWKDIVVTNQAQLDTYSTGSPIRIRDGSLVRDDTSVYVIENGKRRPVESAQVFLDAGYDWQNVQKLPADVLDDHPQGATFSDPNYIPNGTVAYSPSSSGVFLVESGKKRPFYNPDIFLNRYAWKDTVQVSDAKLNSLPRGKRILPRSGSLLADDTRVYLIDGNQKRPVSSARTFLERGYAWENVRNVGQDTLDLLQTGMVIK
jgi:hypothetical protein